MPWLYAKALIVLDETTKNVSVHFPDGPEDRSHLLSAP